MASLQANTTKRINEVWKMNLSSLFIKEKINNLHFSLHHDYAWWKRTKLITYIIMGVGTVGSCLIGIILMFFQLLWNKEGIDHGHLWLVVAGICCCLFGAIVIICLLAYTQIITNKFKTNYQPLFNNAINNGYLSANKDLYPDVIRLCFYANNPKQWPIDYPFSIFKGVDQLWGLIIIFSQIKQYQVDESKFNQLHQYPINLNYSLTNKLATKPNNFFNDNKSHHLAKIYYLFLPSYVVSELDFDYQRIINQNKSINFDFKLTKNINWLIKQHFYQWIFYLSWWIIFMIAIIITGLLSKVISHYNEQVGYSLFISCLALIFIAIICFLCIGATITTLIYNKVRNWLTTFQDLWNKEQLVQNEKEYPLIVQMAFSYHSPDLWNEKHPDHKFHYAYAQLGLLSMLCYLKHYQTELTLNKK